MRLAPSITAVLLFLVAVPAAGEPTGCRLCATTGDALTAPGAGEAKPMALEVQTSLDFDRVILTGPAGGTARLGPDGTRRTSGALAEMSGRAMIGEIMIRGEPGRQVRIDLPSRVDLHGFTGGALAITQIVSDLPSLPRLDENGRLRVRFGGDLFVSGDAEGQYRGDVPITVDYL